MANRRISELQEAAGISLAEQDLFTVVSVNEVDPGLRNKKLTISGTKAYLNIYYLPRTGGTVSGAVVIQGDLTVSGSFATSGLTATGTSTFGSVIVQTGLTVTGNISGTTITGGAISGLTVQGTTVSGTTVTGNTVNGISGNFTTRLSGTLITGNTISGTSGVFQNLSGLLITGNTVQATTGIFSTLSTPSLVVSGNLTIESGLVVSGTAQFATDVRVTGTLSGATITGTAIRGTNITGVAGVFTTSVSGAVVTGDAGRFTTVTGTTVIGTTSVSGLVVTGDAGRFGTVTGITGVFTQILSGATITGGTGQFTNLTGVTIVGTTTVSGATVTGNAGAFTDITGGTVVGTTSVSGAVVTGNAGRFTNVTGTTIIGTTTVSGATVTGNAGSFTNVTGVTVVGTTTVSGATVTGNAGLFSNLTGIAIVGTTSISSATVTGNAGQFTNVTGGTVVGTTSVSGATVTGTTGQFTTVTGISGAFTVITGTTVTGTTANFASGIYTTIISGATVTGTTGQFTTVTGVSGAFTVITGATVTGTTANFASGIYTTIVSGATVTGATGLFTTLTATTGTFTNLNFTSATIGGNLTVSGSGFIVSGLSVSGTVSGVTFTGTTGQFTTVTGTNANFTNGTFSTLTGVTTVITTGIFGAGSAAAPSIAFTGDLNTGIYSPAADTIAFTEGGVEAMRIDSSGRLLVGTSSAPGSIGTAPYAKIQIEGNIFSGTGPGSIALRRGSAPASVSAGVTIGQISFATNDNSEYAWIEAFGDGASGTNDYPGRLVFSTTADGATIPTERLRIDSSGRVGIGTTSPAYKIDVQGGNYGLDVFGANDGANYLTLRSGYAPSGTGGIGFQCYQGDIGNYDALALYGYGGLRFNVNGSERARIDSSGRVGIGTSSPATALDVAGQINASTGYASNRFAINTTPLSTTSTVQSFLQFQSTGGNFYAGIESSTGGTFFPGSTAYAACLFNSASTPLQFFTGGTIRATIDTSGRLGIGTTSPVTKLDVRTGAITAGTADGTSGAELLRGYYSGDGALVVIGSEYSSGGLVIGCGVKPSTVAASAFFSSTGTALARGAYTIAGDIHKWYIGASQTVAENSSVSLSEAMRIDSLGRVGIGTTNPGSLLTLANAATTDIRLIVNSTIQALIYSSSSSTNIFSVTTNPLIFGTNNTERARIDSSGRLLVGTSSGRSSTNTFEGTSFSSSSLTLATNQNSTQPSYLQFYKSRGTTVGSTTIVNNGDVFGIIGFSGLDGSNAVTGAEIGAFVDSTPGTNDMPGRLVFSTTADGAATPTERMRITSAGNVGIGVTPVTKLDLSGNYSQNITAVAALDLDLSTSNYFTKTINANSTFTVSNTPASRVFSFTLELTHTSGTVTFFANVQWPNSTPPTLTTGKTHLFMFVTDDGGSRWRASSLINYTT